MISLIASILKSYQFDQIVILSIDHFEYIAAGRLYIMTWTMFGYLSSSKIVITR